MTEKELEVMLKKNFYLDSSPDFNRVWENYQILKKEGRNMAEKKEGIKLFLWFASFCLLIIVGWVLVSRYSAVFKKEKIDKGEAIVATVVVGDVSVKKMGAADWKKLKVEDILQMGDYLRTGKDSFCELQMIKRGVFKIDALSEIYLANLINVDGKINSQIKLAKGGIGLKPKKLEKDEVFEVHTESAIAAVRGTKFYVSVDETGDTKVAVSEGKVAVTPKIKAETLKKEGLVDEASLKKIQEEVIKPVEIKSGEEVSVKKESVEKIDQVFSEAVKTIVSEKGGEIQNMEKGVPVLASEIANNIQKKLEEIAQKKEKSLVENVSTFAIEKKEVSPEIKQKLDNITEDRIIEKIEDKVKILFDSNPRGAKVFVNEKELGITPLEIVIEKGKNINVRLEKEGFEPFVQEYTIAGGLNIQPTLKEKIKEMMASSSSSKIKEELIASSSVASVIEPGSLEWEKSIKLEDVKFDYVPVLYKGKIYGVAGDRILILSLDGKLIDTIKVFANAQVTRLAVSGNIVVAGTDKGGLYAYSTTGKLLWKNNEIESQKFGASPVIYGDKIYAPGLEKGIRVFTLDGKEVDRIPVRSPIYSAPFITENGKKIIVATEDGTISCFDIETKNELWKVSSDARILYPLIGSKSMVFTLTRASGELIAYSIKDGSKMWSVTFPAIQKSDIEPVYYNGKIILTKQSQEKSVILIVDSQKGKLESTIEVDEMISHPYIFDNKIYFGGDSGKIYCYSIEKGSSVWVYKPAKKGLTFVVAGSDGVYGISKNKMVKVVR